MVSSMGEYSSITGDSGARSAVVNAATRAGTTAREAVHNARDKFRDLVGGEMPVVRVDWTPFSRSADLTLVGRVALALALCRPWQQFADAKALGLPGAREVKARYMSNGAIYFYNYLWLAIGALATSGVLHRCDSVITLALIAVLYVAYTDDIHITGRIVLGDRTKAVFVLIAALWTLLFGGVISFIFNAAVFGFVVYAAHGLLREHVMSADADEENVVYEAPETVASGVGDAE